MDITVDSAWTQMCARLGELDALEGVLGLLEWDQQTMMPPGGASHRGDQMSVVSGVFHEKLTDPHIGDWLDTLSAETDPVRVAAVRNLRRRYDRAIQIPTRLVRILAQASSDGFGAWMRAREADDFAPFSPALHQLVELQREVVGHYPPAAHPYDHLLEDFDPGSTVAELQPMFDRLVRELGDFVRDLADREGPVPVDVHVPPEALDRVGRRIVDAMGFRMDDGRIDPAEHPFTVGIGANDVRLTTHLYADDILSSLAGTIHEAGHGLYEQGLPVRWAGTGLARAPGMGLHESQSRFWENVIGRSLPFLRWLVPMLRAEVPSLDLTPEQLYGAANRVERSLIRVHADEATYNLHIAVRFQLELALLENRIEVKDLPDAWANAYADIVGVRPTTPRDGVLQDVHWSGGMFGYFPSYTIGNLYAAAFRFQMEQDLPDMWAQTERGEFSAILEWLRTHVHDRGHIADPPEIFADAVGDRDPVADLIRHLRGRHGALYAAA